MLLIIPKHNKKILVKIEDEIILTSDELKCSCNNFRCKHTAISTVLIEKFKILRLLVGKPIIITSAYRCDTHNISVGGSDLSQHKMGFALDMLPPKGLSLDEFQKLAKLSGFTYTIVYHDKGFLHADVRGLD